MDETFQPEFAVGVLLAGGNARRMGGCIKCLLPLADKSILAHVVERAQNQVGTLTLNTNSDPALFARYKLPLIADTLPGFAGPLAGLLAAMEWNRAQPHACDWIASFPTDSPFFPRNLVERLYLATQESGAQIACAISGDQPSPLFALWSTELADDLAAQLNNKRYKVADFLQNHHNVLVDFACDTVDPFFNINTVEQLKEARELLGKLRGENMRPGM